MQLQRVCHDTLDFVSVPGFPSAIRVFALTHSRRIVFNDAPWLISFSLDKCSPHCVITGKVTLHEDRIARAHSIWRIGGAIRRHRIDVARR